MSGNTVAFEGQFGGPNPFGIFTGSGGPLTTIAKSGDPGPSGTFLRVKEPSISGEIAAFHGDFGDPNDGVFVGSGGPLTFIAKRVDPSPTGPFIAFGPPAISGDNIAFWGAYGVGNQAGIFSASGESLTTIARVNDVTPLGELTFIQRPVSISGDTVAFLGAYRGTNTSTGLAIFTGSGGPLEAIVKTGGPARSGTFLSLREASISGQDVSFMGTDNDGLGLFKLDASGTLSTIVRVRDSAPIGPFTSIREAISSDEAVAFFGSYGGIDANGDFLGGEGIFVGENGNLTSVIKTGDQLFGSTVEFLFDRGFGSGRLGFDPNGSGNVAFVYQLIDGRLGIALARPIPEPSTLTLFALVLGWRKRARNEIAYTD